MRAVPDAGAVAVISYALFQRSFRAQVLYMGSERYRGLRSSILFGSQDARSAASHLVACSSMPIAIPKHDTGCCVCIVCLLSCMA
jgi:hypothetical protein